VDEQEGGVVTAVDVRGLHVELDGAPILTDVHTEVGFGEWLGVIGPNGAGKTTLLKALAGLVPCSGAVELEGVPPGRRHRRVLARQVAYVPQDPAMPEGMTVFEYVLLGRTAHLPYLAMERATDLAVVRDVIARLDLAGLDDRLLGSLSGGEQQRAVLARALAQQSPVLLLDEPTSALDVGHQQQVLELVETLRREHGLAVVSAMHDLTLAGQFADRLLLLSGGRVIATGSAPAVLTEAIVSEHWGARVRVINDLEGGVVVIPVRERRPSEVADGRAASH
jgi:iron complex transport system ATP-binding protein